MLSEVFYWLFNMSIVASLTGICILLIRCIEAIPRRIITILWIIPFIRMWIPIGIGGKHSLMSIISMYTTKTVIVYESDKLPSLTDTNIVMAAKSYFPVKYKVNLVGDVFYVSSIVWMIIAVALFIAFIILYFSTMHDISDSVHLYKNVYTSDKVTSPSVYGIFNPKILIPPSIAEKDELYYVLLHELKHIHRHDNLRRILAFASISLHWFNPFAWIFLKCFFEDIELACDESVLKKCRENEKKKYASALISCMEQKTLFVSAFGGAKIHRRIEKIIAYKKMTVLSIIVFLALITAISYFLLTNAYI